MKQFILIFTMLLCVTGIWAQDEVKEVTEETRDAAYSAPTTMITGHKWIDKEEEVIYSFLPNGTFDVFSETSTDEFIVKYHMKGTWSRQNKEFLILKANNQTAAFTIVNKSLSERRLAEVKRSAAQKQKEERAQGIIRYKYTIGKLDKNVMLLAKMVMYEGKEQVWSWDNKDLLRLERYVPATNKK